MKKILSAVLCAFVLILSGCGGELTYTVYDDGENMRYNLDFSLKEKSGLDINETAFAEYFTALLPMYGFTPKFNGLSFSAEKSVPKKNNGDESSAAQKRDELFFIKYTYTLPHPLAEYAATDFNAVEKKPELDDNASGETRHNVFGSEKGYDDSLIYVLKYGFWMLDGFEIEGTVLKPIHKQIKPIDEALGTDVLSYFNSLTLNFCYILPLGWHSNANKVYRSGGYGYHTWTVPQGGAAEDLSLSYYYPSQWIWIAVASLITVASVFVMYAVFKPKNKGN